MKPYPCIESTLELVAPNRFHVRLWRDADSLEEADQETFEDVIELVRSQKWASAAALTDAVAKLPRINAVQVQKIRDIPTRGVIAYVNWP
jgi:hypothetical protein